MPSLTQHQRCHILNLLPYNSPVLRKKTQSVKFPLSKTNKQLIQDMKYSIQPEQLKKANAPWDAGVGMAANQWGSNKRIFLFCPNGDTVNGLEVVINPTYTPCADAKNTAAEQNCIWEGCFSIPLAVGKIKRYLCIQVTYQNENGEVIKKELRDWEARVFQHETDHLNGILYDDKNANKCIKLQQFSTKEEVAAFRKQMQSEQE